MVVIAISGASTSGKSILAQWISECYSCKIIELDAYFFHPSEMPTVSVADREVANWEVPKSLDWDPFIERLSAARQSPLTIVEGFILFADPRVASLCDIAIVLTYDESEFEIALSRRLLRDSGNTVPADYRENPLESKAHFNANYFEQVIWAEMLKHPEYIDPPRWNKPRLVHRATDDIEAIRQRTKAFLDPLLEKKRCRVF
jgi:uridine kinase